MMRKLPILCFLMVCCAVLFATSAGATVIWDNGPGNGTIGSIDITGGQPALYDSFYIPSPTALASLTFVAWVPVNTVLQTVAVDIWDAPGAGTHFVSIDTLLTQSNCATNASNMWVCQEAIDLTGVAPPFAAGTYWVGLSLANLAIAGWDINDGVGCTSPGCPSQATDSPNGFPQKSSAFTVYGDVGQQPTPEPGSLMLLASGVGAAFASLRRRRA